MLISKKNYFNSIQKEFNEYKIIKEYKLEKIDDRKLKYLEQVVNDVEKTISKIRDIIEELENEKR